MSTASDVVDAPAWDAPVVEWRRYAGVLRQQIGAARRERDEALEKLRMTVNSKRRDRRLLNQVEKDLADGDIPAAVDRLAWRRSLINAKALQQMP